MKRRFSLTARVAITIVLLLTITATACKKTSQGVTLTKDSTDISEQVRYAEITGSGVNARKGPGIRYRVEFQLGKKEKVKVLTVEVPESGDTAFTVHDWVDDGKGNFSPPYEFCDAVMIEEHEIDEYATLTKGMAVRVCFSADPGGHGWVHVEYVIEGVKDTLKLHDEKMVAFRDKVKPLGATPWYKVETESGRTGWVYGEYVKEE